MMRMTLDDAKAEHKAIQISIAEDVRPVTEAELEFYYGNGWVKMERLISPQLAARMLELAKAEILDKAPDDVRSHDRGVWHDVYHLGRDDHIEPFYSLVRSPVIGRNAQLFMRRDIPVGMHNDMLAVKMPGGTPTGWHQDFPNFPLDRNGLLTFWIALDDLTPEQGTMHFQSGSHKEGPLGRRNLGADERGLLDHVPYLEKLYPRSEPISLKAGDCTVHSCMVVHGAPANLTDRPRWSYLLSCYPGDACWTGAPHHNFNADAGLTPGQPALSPRFPIIAQPRG